MDKKDIVDVIADIVSGSRALPRNNPTKPLPSGCAEDTSGYAMMAPKSLVKAAEQHFPKKGFFASENFNTPFTALKSGRPFISEYDLKRMLKDNPSLAIKIPRNAIISPLALEIIETKGVKIIYV